jgi:23S rRNA (guanosine2251-2'-O)-methyltransferase
MSDPQENIIGIHAVAELLKQLPDTVIRLIFQSGRDDPRLAELKDIASMQGIASEEMDKRSMDKRFDGVHQGAVAISKAASRSLSEKELTALLDKLDHDPLLLVLDGVTDPHNLGACLRTADAAGVDAVIIPKDKSVGLNPTVRKVACGAAETVNLVSVTNLTRCLQRLKERGIWIMGAADQADSSIYQQEMTGAIALVMGSEGAGLRRLTKENCDFLVSIPMAGQLSSLNVSVATGVCLYEAARQRGFKPD